MKPIESIKEHGGYLNRYTHESASCACSMTFSVYLPPQASKGPVPVLYWLSGLTCSDDNARTKGGFQRYAAQYGIAIVFPDTSPRGEQVADAPERYDLGQAAGFYVDASEDPWRANYRMYEYVSHELPALVEAELPLQAGNRSIFGHSMGGHGALICALKNPSAYRSVSAFAPIANPVNCAWGQGCFGAYLGADPAAWEAWDATCLVRDGARVNDILIDQGDADEFLAEGQLLPENFAQACRCAGQPCTIRMQAGYDHSYHFIGSFVESHFDYHATALGS